MSIWTWFEKVFDEAELKVNRVVVSILQAVQGLEDSGVLPFIAKILDKATGHLSTEINEGVKKAVTAGLVTELAIAGLPANPTEQDIKDFDSRVISAFAGKKAAQSMPGQVVSQLGAQLYNIIHTSIGQAVGKPLTCAVIITDIEQGFQDFLQDEASANAAQTDDPETQG